MIRLDKMLRVVTIIINRKGKVRSKLSLMVVKKTIDCKLAMNEKEFWLKSKRGVYPIPINLTKRN